MTGYRYLAAKFIFFAGLTFGSFFQLFIPGFRVDHLICYPAGMAAIEKSAGCRNRGSVQNTFQDIQLVVRVDVM